MPDSLASSHLVQHVADDGVTGCTCLLRCQHENNPYFGRCATQNEMHYCLKCCNPARGWSASCTARTTAATSVKAQHPSLLSLTILVLLLTPMTAYPSAAAAGQTGSSHCCLLLPHLLLRPSTPTAPSTKAGIPPPPHTHTQTS